jgi:3-oxoadipate enol-lactonase
VSGPVALHCREEGDGPVPIVLLHGLAADHTVWNGVLPKLAPGHRLLAPDLRGHGRSPAPPDSSFGFEELEADLLALLAAKSVDSAHLVGLSAGALLALRLGLDRPEKVRSVTLIGGASYVDPHIRAVTDRWAHELAEGGPDALALRLLKDLYYPDWIDAHLEVADRLRAVVARQDFGRTVRWGQQLGSFDERPRIASLRPPALIVQAMEDAVVESAHGRILRQSIPGARMRIFAQTGHLVPIERPEETAEAIATFVDEVEKGRSA